MDGSVARRRTVRPPRYRFEAQAAVPPVVALVVPGVSECILRFKGDVDEIVRRAQAADATIVTEPAQQPWATPAPSPTPTGTSGWGLAHQRGDRQRAARLGHRHAVVAVADRVGVADLHDRDGRERDALLDGEPDALPAAAGQGLGPEVLVELRRAVRLGGAGDRRERDVGDGARAGAPLERFVVHRQAANGPAGPAHAAEQRGPAARPRGGGERTIGLESGPVAHADRYSSALRSAVSPPWWRSPHLAAMPCDARRRSPAQLATAAQGALPLGGRRDSPWSLRGNAPSRTLRHSVRRLVE